MYNSLALGLKILEPDLYWKDPTDKKSSKILKNELTIEQCTRACKIQLLRNPLDEGLSRNAAKLCSRQHFYWGTHKYGSFDHFPLISLQPIDQPA